MENKEFKKIFDNVAITNGFKRAFGGWFKESPECIAILELQKSNFGNYYQLNIKIFIQGVFNRIYSPSKDLIKSSMGHVNNNETKEYKDVLDFDTQMQDDIRVTRLEKLFLYHIVPFTEKVLLKSGIQELSDKGEIFLLPAIKQELT